jgi:hypothetical protein
MPSTTPPLKKKGKPNKIYTIKHEIALKKYIILHYIHKIQMGAG